VKGKKVGCSGLRILVFQWPMAITLTDLPMLFCLQNRFFYQTEQRTEQSFF
jgi:hypothetical protein